MDSTWEPIENLVTDVPELGRSFLNGLHTKEAAQVRSELALEGGGACRAVAVQAR